MNLTRTDWTQGWTPSADAVNGDPRGLLRSDNLTLDENGVLGLSRGFKQLNSNLFSDYAEDLFAVTSGAQEWTYASLHNGSSIFRSKSGDFSDSFSIPGGGDRTRFAACFGQVLVCSGSQRWKDDGSNLNKLGLQTAAKPTVSISNQPTIQFGASNVPAGYLIKSTVNPTWSNQMGTDFSAATSAGYEQTVDDTTLIGVAIGDFGGPQNLLNIGEAPAADPSQDVFICNITPDDSTKVLGVQLDFLLNPSPTDQDSVTDYYTFQWTNDNLLPGTFQLSPLTATRGQFLRTGSNSALDWSTVTGARVSVTMSSVDKFFFTDIFLSGGTKGQLNGQYQWVQVNLNDNGFYRAQSPTLILNQTDVTTVFNGYVTLTPSAVEAQVNKIQFYRIANNTNLPAATPGNIDQTNNETPESFLQNYFLVAETTPGTPVDDTTSDIIAIEEGVTLNQFLISLQPLSDGNGLNDTIVGMEGIYNERMLYLGRSYLYLSHRLDPDSIDNRYTLKVSGDPTEINLWIKKITNQLILWATSKNLYALNGTLLDLPDGTLDAVLNPIGEAYPPLSSDCAAVNGAIFYVAADGIRTTVGSNSTLVSPQLRLLFQNSNRYGIPPVAVYPGDILRYSIAVGKTKMYVALPLSDGTRRLIIYDLLTQTFRLSYTDPVLVYATPSDRVLLGFNDSFNPVTPVGTIYQAEQGTGWQDNGGTVQTGLQIYFQTIFDANSQPRNRKDTFTLKLIADTGGAVCSVYIAKDGNENSTSWTFLQNFSSNGIGTTYIPLNNVTLGFRYAIKIVDVATLEVFKLYEMTIEYEPRPEQVDYLRLLPTNMNSYARKRWTSFAYVIDTLGNSISFQPYVDNAATGAADTVATNTKLTHITFFNGETIGTDIGGVFSGGVFEFYGVNIEETVSEKLPTPCTFLVIPANDYGKPNRKRHSSYKFQINTRGANVVFTPIIDGIAQSSATVKTTSKKTVEYFFTQDTIGIDIGGTLASTGTTPFEFYGVIVPQEVELLPSRLDFFLIPPNDYGTPNRKRFSSFKFQINTNGDPVTFTPIVDQFTLAPMTFIADGKKTIDYYFTLDTVGVDIGGTLKSTTSTPFEFYGVIVPQQVETLPPRLEYFLIPPSNYGTPNRKRHTSYKFEINTNGQPVTFTPVIDLLQHTSLIVSTPSKQTVEYFFHSDTIGIDIGGILSSNTPTPFEYYGTLVPQDIEVLPPRLEYFVIPNNNLGHTSRKRFIAYAFVINTNGADVIFTPYIDNALSHFPLPTTFTVNTPTKQTYIAYFYDNTEGTDIGGTLASVGSTPFEFYAIDLSECVSEKLPPPATFYLVPANDYGTPNRKRFTSFKFQINTKGNPCVFSPFVDGNARGNPLSFSTIKKLTVEYFFDPSQGDVTGIDIGGTIQSWDPHQPFEFYGVIVPQDIEVLPPRLRYFVIPSTNYGTPHRKRHSSYKFEINTNGMPVTFTPTIDMVQKAPKVFTTASRETVEYFFTVDTIGIDVSGTLASNTLTPFEFYKTVTPEEVETLPSRLEYFRIPNNNLGVASRKRLRTLPMVIDTYGQNVIFTPIVDGVLQGNTSTFNTTGKTTVYHFFIDDSFGIDYGGQLVNTSGPFEFYGLGSPEDVETLPVPKLYDQLGPTRFDKIGKIFGFRLRAIFLGSTNSVNFKVFGDGAITDPTYGTPLYHGTFSVNPNIDGVYEIQFPKSINTDVFRLTIGPTADPFHRYDIFIKVQTSGMESESKWLPLR